MSSVVSEKPIIFKRISGGYLIGKVMFIASLGFDYLYMLLRSPHKYISCPRLEMGLESTEADLEDHPVLQEIGVYSHAEGSISSHQDEHDRVALSQYRVRVREIENMDSLVPVLKSELKYLKYVLNNETYRGKSKGIVDEKEKSRQRVTKDIKREIIKLIKHPDTEVMLIGLHFKDNVTTGYECRYVGDRAWVF